MILEVKVLDRPIVLDPRTIAGCGAVARFEGIVRDSEQGNPIAALEYEAYLPMAENKIRQILTELHVNHPFALARVFHRIGTVPAGEAAIVMDVHAPHRAETFAVLAKFMDRLKQDVPIWKTGVVEKISKDTPKGTRTSRPRTSTHADGTSAFHCHD